MKTWALRLLVLGSAVAALGVFPATVQGQALSVLLERKISDTQGNFLGAFDDNDKFGTSVSYLGDLDGDGIPDLVVGKPNDDLTAGTDNGAAYVLFLRANGTVKQFRRITQNISGFSETLADGSHFGSAVAGIGDLNGDGIEDIVVGAPTPTGVGSIYVLIMNSDGTVFSSQRIGNGVGGLSTTLNANDRFGQSVANLGDIDSDGVTDIAVGMPGPGNTQGEVLILLMNSNGTVKAEQKIANAVGGFPPLLQVGDEFGTSVAGIGDLNGDGVEDLAVGAVGSNEGGTDRGAVYILFLKRDGTVNRFQEISHTAGNLAASISNDDAFGTSVAGLGDLDGDNNEDIAVGLARNLGSGSVYILLLDNDGTVKTEQRLAPGSGLTGPGSAGASVAPVGDLDNDGQLDIVIGDPFDSDGGIADRGSIWLLYTDADDTITPPPHVAGDKGLPTTAPVQAGFFTEDGQAYVGTYGFGVYKWSSTNGWEQKNNGLTNPWVYGLVSSATTLYAATWGGGIFKSTNGGDTWTHAGLPNAHVRGLSISQVGNIYATGDFSEVWKLVSGDWILVGNVADYATEPWDIAVHPANEDHLFAATRYGLYESMNAGLTWSHTLSGVEVFSVKVHPVTEDVYVGTQSGVVRRDRGSSTFNSIRSTASAAYSLAFDRFQRLYVGYWGPPGVEMTDDAGVTWNPLLLAAPLEAASKTGSDFRVTHVLIDDNTGRVMVTTERKGAYLVDTTAPASGVAIEDDELPTGYALEQNYPNPFNPVTSIRFHVPQASAVRLAVYDMLGREVQVLLDGAVVSGTHQVAFDAANLSSGVYMYRLQTDIGVHVRTMQLLK